jgi:DmsE family decaheme c-type cytochrome
MRFLPALAAALVCLGGWIGPAAAAGLDADASKVCVKCHDAEDLPDMSRRAHAAAADPRAPTCVTCHGPSPTHVNKPEGVKERPHPDRLFRRTADTPISERNGACLTCHAIDSKRTLWAGSAHETSEVACTTCHRIHSNEDKVQAKATQTDVCYACHKEQRTQLMKPSHHPIPEGKMTCSDCHNVHGSAGPSLARRDSTNDTCYTCHAEKRGPFVHEHEPVREDCATCHNPHGSVVASLLKARAPILCQQCHTPHVAGDVGALGGQRGVFPPAAPGQVAPAINGTTSGKNVINMWQGRACTNCHTQVHGSNNPSVTNPTPQFLFR